MSWVQMDDHFADHPKVLGMGDFAPLAIALQVRAFCYAARYLTDGFIPDGAIPGLLMSFDKWGIETGGVPGMMSVGSSADLFDWPAMMVSAGLWEAREGGFAIHDYLEYNPSKAVVLKRRESDRKRKHLKESPRTPAGIQPDSTSSPSPSPSPKSSLESNSSVGASDLAGQSSAPLHPQLHEALSKTKKLKALANGKHADLWESLDNAYGHYDWLLFDEEVLKADAWILANPRKAPTERGLPAFIRNWFDRAVERGRTKR